MESIAGRSPTYLLRQLMAMKAGTRAGAGALLMQPIVASMSLDDMVSAVAYAASFKAASVPRLWRAPVLHEAGPQS